MALQDGQTMAAARLPQAHHFVSASAGKQRAIRTIGQRVNLVAMSCASEEGLPIGHAPQPYIMAIGASSHLFAVGAKGKGADDRKGFGEGAFGKVSPAKVQ